MKPRMVFTRISHNAKTGPIPISMTEARTCPSTCPLATGGCYAKTGNVNINWSRLTAGRIGMSWGDFLAQVRRIPKGSLWRHNVAGDLPGDDNRIDAAALAELVTANERRRGFTYTHKPMTKANAAAVKEANARGFTVNLSANRPADVDALVDLAVGPVVTVLPANQLTNLKTAAGRTIVVCPAVTHEDVSCSSCGLCARADRPSIIGFPAHGGAKRKANAIAGGV